MKNSTSLFGAVKGSTTKLFLLLFTLFTSLSGVWGQTTITIGSGTNQGNRFPVSPYYWYTYSQQIVLKTDVNTAGLITKLRFYSTGNTLTNSDNWTIYLGHTSKTAFSSNTDWIASSSMTQVFSGIVPTPSTTAGWFEIDINDVFVYNNVDNLVIAVDENAPNYTGLSTTNYFRIWTTPVTNRGIYVISDSSNPDPTAISSITGTRTSYIAQMQLELAPVPTCMVPTALTSSSISYQTATIGWTAPTSGTSPGNYEYEIRTSGAAGSGASGLVTSGTVATNSASVTGLTGGTPYTYYVRSSCGSGDFSTWTSGTFTTTSCASLPTSVSSNTITINSANISWTAATGSPAGYEYEVRTAGAAGSGSTGLVTTGTTTSPTVIASITGLSSNTTHSTYVRTVCYSGYTSAWTSASTFTTLKIEPTNQATNLVKGSLATNSIPLTWTAADAGSQAPDGYLMLVNTGTITDPVDGTDPGNGSSTITAGAASLKTSSLTATFSTTSPGTMYNVKMYSYTNSGTNINYNTTNPTSINVASLPSATTSLTSVVTGTSQIAFSWTAASNYSSVNHSTLVFVKATSAVTAGTPSTAPSAYTANPIFGSGTAYQNDAAASCVYKGDGTSVTVTGLSANTTYFVSVYVVVDASNSDNTNSYSAVLNGSATSSKIEPTNQATNLVKGSLATNSIPLTWTAADAGSQAPDGYLMLVNTGTITDPVDGTDPGNGSTTINAGAASLKTSSLTATFSTTSPGTMYNVKMYSYTNSGTNINYNTTNPTSINVASLPSTPTTFASTVGGTSQITFSWASGTGYSSANHSTLVFVKAASSITLGTPSSAPSAYTANTIFGSGTAYQNDVAAYCVYKGDGTSVIVTGLTVNTTYFVSVYVVVDASNSDNTNSYSAALTGSATTAVFSSVTSGNWNSPSTWNSGGVVPSCTDNVTIANGHTVTVNSTSNVSKNLTIASGGTLVIASGDLTVGCTLNNTPLSNNGTLTVSGGTLNVNGNLASNSGSSINQSGGEINIDGNNGGNSTGSVLTGTSLLHFYTSNISFTGGAITILDPHVGSSASDYSFGYSFSSTVVNSSASHTINIGNGISTNQTSNLGGFIIDPYISSGRLNFGNLNINTAVTAGNRFVTFPEGIGLLGNLNIADGSEARLSGSLLVVIGGNIVNNGVLVSASTSFVLGRPNTTSIASIANPNSQIISGTGSFINSTATTTASLTNLTINNTNSTGVTLNVPLSVSGTLTMTAGKINTSATNLLTLGTATAAGTLSYAGGQITGPFARTFAASSNTTADYTASTLFPVGDGVNYIPIHIDPVTGAGPVVMRGQAFNTNSGIAGTGVATVSSDRWEALITSGSSNLTSCFIGLNDAQVQTGNLIAQASSSNGIYNALAQTPTITANSFIRTSTAIPTASYLGYFTYGTPVPSYTWTGATSTAWSTTSNWNPASVPPSSANITIPSTGITNFPEATTITIETGKTLTLNSGAQLTISGALTNNGTLTLESGATLVQGASSTLAGTGTYNVKQDITGSNNGTAPSGRFWYLGSPVSLASSSAYFTSNAANVVKKRDEVNNAWTTLSSGTPENLVVGRGYYTQAMGNATINFTGGLLNNGAITIGNLTRTAGQGFEGFNLVSNPYPSYLNWDLVTPTNVDGTIWYRTFNSTTNSMVFDTYVANAANGIGTNLSGNTATKYIPPMQSFWVRVTQGQTSGSLALDNSMRSHFASLGNSTAGLRSTNDELKLFLRMNLLQAGKKDQIIVYVNDIATNGFDQFDGEKMMQTGLPQFYTSAAGKKITINGLNSAKKQQALPITMELPTTGVHSFVIEDLEIDNGLVWLEDKQEEIMQALEPGTVYEFYANSGINAERFVLHFQLIDNTTPINVYNEVNSSANFSGKGASVHAESAGVVVIKLPASTEGITDIQIRDAAGKLVYTGSTNTLETSVQLEQANGIYYVTLNSASGVEVRKVFIQQ